MIPPIFRKITIVTGLAALVFLVGCSTANRWNGHAKENGEPKDPKFEAPLQQLPEGSRETPRSASQEYAERKSGNPQVIEGNPMGNQNEPVLFGIALDDKPGFVLSPYAPDKGLIDVTGFPVGTPVRDPYTWKMMKVPPVPENQKKAKEQTLAQPVEQEPEIPEIQ